jgi:hypothetical protein
MQKKSKIEEGSHLWLTHLEGEIPITDMAESMMITDSIPLENVG